MPEPSIRPIFARGYEFGRTAAIGGVRCGNRKGFTLVELVVVITLLSLMFFIALPSFQQALTNNTRSVSRWFLWKIPQLKHQAATEKKQLTLHVGVSGNRLWVTHEGMTEDQLDDAPDTGYELPEGMELLDVEFPNDNVVSSGVAEISFYPRGYSDRAIIHLATDDDERLSYFVEPFLNKVKLLESYAGYDD